MLACVINEGSKTVRVELLLLVAAHSGENVATTLTLTSFLHLVASAGHGED